MTRPTLAALLLVTLLPAFALADAATARKFIQDAKEAIGIQNWDNAEEALKLAEASLDDATPAEQEAIKKEIAQTRTDAVAASASLRRRPFMFKLNDLMENAKRYMGQPREFNPIEKELNELFVSEDAKLFLKPEDITKYKKELAALKKVSQQQFGAKAVTNVKEVLEKAEREMPAWLKSIETPDAPDQIPASRSAQDMANELEKVAADLPDSDEGKKLKDRVQKMLDAYASACTVGESAEYLKRMKADWINESSKFEGWKSEPEGPSITDALTNYSDTVAAFNAPKTIAMIGHANRWLDIHPQGETYERVKNVPAIKQMVETIRKDRDAGLASLEARAEKVLAALEAKKEFSHDETQGVQRLRGRFDYSLRGSSKVKEYEDRVAAVMTSIEKMAANKEQGRKELEETMSQAASAAWPKLSGAIKADEVGDPNSLSKGQTIRINKMDNRMRWDYGGGSSGYDWGVTINGHPIVGHYAPHVNAAIKQVAEKLPTFDMNDEMDVIAVVVGKGQVERRNKTEVRDSGGSRLGDVERWDPVDCVVVKVIALRGGPVAVGPDGMASESGGVEPVKASAGMVGISAPSSGWMARVLWTLLGLSVAAATFAKARPQVALQAVGAGGSNAMATVSRNFDYIGLAAVLVGTLWLLSGWVYRDLLPAAAMIACGVYLASDLLKDRGVLKSQHQELLKSQGATIALMAAGAIVLHAIAGGLPLV